MTSCMPKSPVNITQAKELQYKVVRKIMTILQKDVRRNVFGNYRNERGDEFDVG